MKQRYRSLCFHGKCIGLIRGGIGGLGKSIKASLEAHVSHLPNRKDKKVMNFAFFGILKNLYLWYLVISCQVFHTYNEKQLCVKYSRFFFFLLLFLLFFRIYFFIILFFVYFLLRRKDHVSFLHFPKAAQCRFSLRVCCFLVSKF